MVLTQYFEAMFYVINRASTTSTEYQVDQEDEGYIQWQLSEWKIRFGVHFRGSGVGVFRTAFAMLGGSVDAGHQLW